MIIAVSVFFSPVLVQNFLNCFERCAYHIKANFSQDENVLGVRRANQKFGSFVYFISVATQS